MESDKNLSRRKVHLAGCTCGANSQPRMDLFFARSLMYLMQGRDGFSPPRYEVGLHDTAGVTIPT